MACGSVSLMQIKNGIPFRRFPATVIRRSSKRLLRSCAAYVLKFAKKRAMPGRDGPQALLDGRLNYFCFVVSLFM